MILSLFVVFLSLSIILIVLGIVKSNDSYLGLIGFFFMFILSLVLINGNLEYKIGETISYTYGDNFTFSHWDYDYSEPPQTKLDGAYLFHTNKTDTYIPYNDSNTHTFGYWLAILSAIGFGLTIWGIKGGWSESA